MAYFPVSHTIIFISVIMKNLLLPILAILVIACAASCGSIQNAATTATTNATTATSDLFKAGEQLGAALKYFSDQFLEKDIAWPTTYVRNDRLHSQPQLTGHNDGFRCRTRGEKVGSGQWHEWKTQAKPCPGRQPHTLPPSGAPLFSSAMSSNPNRQVLPLPGSAPMERCGTL